MLASVLEEISPYYQEFQSAGIAGCKRLRELPYDGEQFANRRLQREPMLFSFHKELPTWLGSFEKVAGTYAANRLVYYSKTHNAELIFRRRGSLSFMSAPKKRDRDLQMPLFQIITNDDQSLEQPRKIALIWDLPELDVDHQPIGHTPLAIKIAKPGTALDHRLWESGATIEETTNLMPKTTTFDPNEPDWEIEDEEFTSEG